MHTVHQRISQLLSIYDFIDQWHGTAPQTICCTEGCATCCTDQVTATETEAVLILENYFQKEMPPFSEGEKRFTQQPPLTTNEFALACMQGRDVSHPDLHRSSKKCSFLSDSNTCTIYPVRPLMCRLFVSKTPCAISGEAEVAERTFTLHVALQQITEDLSEGYRWGNLTNLLQFLSSGDQRAAKALRCCIKNPGFLIPPDEVPFVEKELRKFGKWGKKRHQGKEYQEESE